MNLQLFSSTGQNIKSRTNNNRIWNRHGMGVGRISGTPKLVTDLKPFLIRKWEKLYVGYKPEERKSWNSQQANQMNSEPDWHYFDAGEESSPPALLSTSCQTDNQSIFIVKMKCLLTEFTIGEVGYADDGEGFLAYQGANSLVCFHNLWIFFIFVPKLQYSWPVYWPESPSTCFLVMR